MNWVWLAFPLVLALDAQNALSHWRRHVIDVEGEPTHDWTACITLYGSPSYFKNREWLSRYRDRVLVILSGLDDFGDELEAEGWRVFRAELGDRAPAPPEMIRAAIEAGAVTSRWCIRMDADVEAIGDIGQAVGSMERAGAEVCSVKTHVANRSVSLWTHFQGVEYDCAMLGRHNRPWCLSGAFFIVRTDLLRAIYRQHSLWFYGEDSETGMVAQRLGMVVKHLDFTVVTEVPETFRAWFRQRRGWWAGAFRQCWVNADHMIRYPAWIIYNAMFVWIALWMRPPELVRSIPIWLPVILLLYTLLLVVANWQVRSEWMAVYPYYALAQVILMPLIGAAYYFQLAIKHRRSGRYRFPTFGNPHPKGVNP